MTIEYEIKNQTKKEKKSIEYDTLLSLENCSLDTLEILQHFYYSDDIEQYKRNKSLRASKAEDLEKELKRFYEHITHEKIGRKKYFKLNGLYDIELLPLQKETKAGKNKLRATLEAIILYVLKNKVITDTDMTTNKWLIKLGLVSEKTIRGYTRFNSNITYDKFINTHFTETFNDPKITYFDFKVNQKYTRELSTKEKFNLLKVYYSHVDTIRNTFNNALMNLEKHNLIIHNPEIYYGKTENDLMRLELEEIKKFIEIQNELKEKLGLEKNRKYYMNAKFKTALKIRLEQGLEVKLYNGKTISNVYTSVFKQKAIINKFSKKQLNKYFEKNADVKKMYDLLTHELMQNYKGAIVDKLNQLYEREKQSKVKYFEDEKKNKLNELELMIKNKKALGKTEKLKDKIINEYKNLIQLQEIYGNLLNCKAEEITQSYNNYLKKAN
ncbi:hypothetical protein LAU42_04960 [Macrococcus armenti]|uniref:hypothetical protein n=1 Tax=Macrococcus armenti TaxID=2875764 RepID=UPI001CCADD35|nr:hypothetical protein [Macrococcus armenti]UBH23292.1 hypothetical protein LAU42_04960 [Macrococcus armenti]